METEKFAKQLIDFQKATFDNTFNTLVMVQDQTERMFETALDQNTWLPAEGRRMIDDWNSAYKKGRTDFKSIVDDGFGKMADLFAKSPVVKTQASPSIKTK
jgi:hypothetical protein